MGNDPNWWVLWGPMPEPSEKAQDISAVDYMDEDIDVIGGKPGSGNNLMYNSQGGWDNGGHVAGIRVATSVAVTQNRKTWICDTAGQIFCGNSKVDGVGQDVGVGADGTVWVVSGKPGSGNGPLLKRETDGWHQVDGQGGIRVTVSKTGIPWICNAAGQVFYHTDTWWRVPGQTPAQDIGIGGDLKDHESIWIVGGLPGSGDGPLYRYDSGTWYQPEVSKSGLCVSVDRHGVPNIVNSAGQIYCGIGVLRAGQST